MEWHCAPGWWRQGVTAGPVLVAAAMKPGHQNTSKSTIKRKGQKDPVQRFKIIPGLPHRYLRGSVEPQKGNGPEKVS
jgi:hypothetical protein